MLVAVFAPRAAHWSHSFYLLGFLGLFWVPIWLWLYDERPSSSSSKSFPGSTPASSLEEKALLIEVGGVAVQRNIRYEGGWCRSCCSWTKSALESGFKYFNHAPLLAIYVAHFCMNWSNYVVMNWLPTYLTSQLNADVRSVSYIALPYLCNFLVNILSGHWADHLTTRLRWPTISVRRLMTGLGLLGPALSLLAFAAVGSVPSALLFVTLAMSASAFNSAGHLANHADLAPKHAGVTFAISNTFATVPGILCGPFTAALVSQSGHRWFPVFVIASAVNAVGAVVYQAHSGARQILA